MQKTIALKIEYLGKSFHGWQFQQNARSVQAELEAAWSRLTGEKLRFKASSRTDAGVSARGLVCHCTSQSRIPISQIPYALNAQLPEHLVVLQAREMALDFSARRQSIGKYYCYRILNRRMPSAFLRDTSYHCSWQLQPELWLNEAPILIGEHDFRAFMDQGSPSPSTIRRLDYLGLRKSGDCLELDVVGSGFLYHMVRILAGTALVMMAGKLSPEGLKEGFLSGDRTALGPTLPAAGLCLERVFFRDEIFGNDDQAAYLKCARGEFELSSERIF